MGKDLTEARMTTTIGDTPAVPMSRIWRTIRDFILWSYERGTLQYDVMVTLILLFVFLSPFWIDFHDKPVERNPHPIGVVVTPEPGGGFIYQIEGSAVAATDDAGGTATAAADCGTHRRRSQHHQVRSCTRSSGPCADLQSVGAKRIAIPLPLVPGEANMKCGVQSLCRWSWRWSAWVPWSRSRPPPIPRRIAALDKVLGQMDSAAEKFRTTEASVVWDQYQKVVDEHEEQKGKVYFRHGTTMKSRWPPTSPTRTRNMSCSTAPRSRCTSPKSTR